MWADDEKMQALILYVSERCRTAPFFGKTKLNKILFYSDFAAFGEWGRPLTGLEYCKYTHGPVAPQVDELVADLCRKGKATLEERLIADFAEIRVSPTREFRGAGLTANERSLADRYIDQFWNQPAGVVSDLSHDFIGWRAAAMGERIPYETMLLDFSPVTPEEDRWMLQILADGR